MEKGNTHVGQLPKMSHVLSRLRVEGREGDVGRPLFWSLLFM